MNAGETGRIRRDRGEAIAEMRVSAVEHRVERIGCALAAIALLGEEDLA